MSNGNEPKVTQGARQGAADGTPQGAGQGGKRVADAGPRQKAFNIVGWAAFLLLLPPVLEMLKLPQLQEAITKALGPTWGSQVALVVYFYVVLFLRVFFGSDQRYTPVLLGYAISFLYFSNSLSIGFMRPLYDFAHQYAFLSHDVMSLIAGVVVVFLANALSGLRKANWILDVVALVVLPAAGLVAAGIYLPGALGF